ncbi:hypothetical protein ACVWYP_001693 [Bradyrhizobium sp. USDA 3262]|jgi:hypothetical protein
MAKGQKRGNREAKKPKQEKAAPKSADPFASQTRLAANTNTRRAKGKARWS